MLSWILWLQAVVIRAKVEMEMFAEPDQSIHPPSAVFSL